MKPTPQFRRHHAVEAPAVDKNTFRPKWRVSTRLDGLFAAHLITAGEWQAASEYRDAWERVLAMARTASLTAAAGGGGGDAHAPIVAACDTVERLRLVGRAVGHLADQLCFACAVEDQPWAWSARQLRRDPHTVRTWTVAAIAALAPAWNGQRGRQRGKRHSEAAPAPTPSSALLGALASVSRQWGSICGLFSTGETKLPKFPSEGKKTSSSVELRSGGAAESPVQRGFIVRDGDSLVVIWE